MSAEPGLEEAPVRRVRGGVFFTRPEVLPRGRHKLTPEHVSEAQRERLLTAVTANCWRRQRLSRLRRRRQEERNVGSDGP